MKKQIVRILWATLMRRRCSRCPRLVQGCPNWRPLRWSNLVTSGKHAPWSWN